MTHKTNVQDAFGQEVADIKEGEALVFKPDASRKPRRVARVQASDWAKVAELQLTHRLRLIGLVGGPRWSVCLGTLQLLRQRLARIGPPGHFGDHVGIEAGGRLGRRGVVTLQQADADRAARRIGGQPSGTPMSRRT